MFEGPIQDLIDEFSRLPGVGPKSAQRIAFHLLKVEPDEIDRLREALAAVRDGVAFCRICSNISREEVEGVGFSAADYDEQAARYDPEKLSYGYNILPDGEEIYFIPNPALGLWIDKSRFEA